MDVYGHPVSTRFTWTVVKPPVPAPKPRPTPKPGRPTSKSVRISGLGRSRPKLTFTVNQGSNAPALKSVAISLPKGVSFDRSRKTLGHGIRLRNDGHRVRFTAVFKKGLLTITFKSTQSSVSVQLTRPTITVSRSEAQKIRHRKIRRLRFGIRMTDAHRATVRYSILLKKIS